MSASRKLTAAAAGIMAVLFGMSVQAADYPTKPIHLMIPQPPGGPTDIGVRIYADKLHADLGQPTVVENRPGAAAQIAINQLVRAPGDGYLLYYGSNAFSSLPYTSKSYDVDWHRQTTPVTIVVALPSGIGVSTALNIHNLDEFLADIKANPGKRNYGSMGTPDFLIMDVFRRAETLPWETIRYNGAAPALQALQAGDVQFTYTTLGTMKPLVDAGKMRVIVVSGDRRSAFMPDVPAITEAKDPALRELAHGGGFTTGWHGVVAPGNTPPEVVDVIYKATAKLANDADFKKRMGDAGFEPLATTPAEMTQRMKDDDTSWARIAKEMNVKPE